MPLGNSNENHSTDLPVTDMTEDLTEKVILNIGGKRFVTSKGSLINIPTTRLGKLSKSDSSFDSKSGEYFFDRNPKLVQCILDLHRTGDLHLPSNICSTAIKAELDYWNVPEDYISECCWKIYSLQNQDLKIAATIDQQMGKVDSTMMKSPNADFRNMLWSIMENPNYNLYAKIWHFVYLTFVMLSITVFCLTTIPEFRLLDNPNATFNGTGIYSEPFYILTHTHPILVLFYLDKVCLVFFTFELPIRFVVSPFKREFFKRPLNLLDLFLVMVMLSAFGIDMSPAYAKNDELIKKVETLIRLFLGLRVFRIFHLARRYPTIKILYLTVKASLRELLLLLVGLTMAVIIFATFVFLAEAMSHSRTFTSIPYAIWWAIITMTTVGYGDVYPTTFFGYLVGICCALSGLLLLSMPIAIIAANFGAYYSNLTVREERMKREHKRAHLRMRNAADALRRKLVVKKLFNVSGKLSKAALSQEDNSSKLNHIILNDDPTGKNSATVAPEPVFVNGEKEMNALVRTIRPQKIFVKTENRY